MKSEGQILSFVASAAVGEKIIVKAHTVAGQVAIGTASGLNIGVTEIEAAAGQTVSVQTTGIVKIIAAEAITAGAEVSSDDAGKAVVAASGETVIGVCVTPVGAADEVVSVLLTGIRIKA